MNLQTRLRDARFSAGITQKEAARRSGVGAKTIASFETGDRIASMKVSQLVRLLDAYQITPHVFFSSEELVKPSFLSSVGDVDARF